MDLNWWLEGFVFSFLVLWTISNKQRRAEVLQKSKENWTIDFVSLSMQGVVVPLMQAYLVYKVLLYLFPQFAGGWDLSPWLAFAVNFIFVDYIYYLTHRTLHKDALWGFHLLHHSSQKMDIFVTSRNSVWTPFLLPYIWLNGTMLFLLSHKSAYLAAMTLTVILDLWRHSEMVPEKKGPLFKILSRGFITPYEHSGHHSQQNCHFNFGANFSLWDKWHGTYRGFTSQPKGLGIPAKGSLITKLFFPRKLNRMNQ